MTLNIRWCLILTVLCIVVSAQTQKRAIDSTNKLLLADDVIAKDRLLRQANPSAPKPRPMGFFGTIKQLAFDQANDTSSAYNQLGELFGGYFADTQPKTPAPPITDNSTTTTEGPPKLSRADFLQLLSRNLRGLRNLYNLEMREAMKDSRKNIQEYKREFTRKVYEQFVD